MAIHKKRISSEIETLGKLVNYVLPLHSPTEQHGYKRFDEDLHILNGLRIDQSSDAAKAERYDLITAMSTHNGLIYPSGNVLEFFDYLFIVKAVLLNKAKKDHKLLSSLNHYIHLFMTGRKAVDISIKFGLISPLFEGTILTQETGKDRKKLTTEMRKEQAVTGEEGLSVLEIHDCIHNGVNLLAGVVKRYANASCCSMEKTLNILAQEKMDSAGKDSDERIGARNVPLRPSIAVKSRQKLPTGKKAFFQTSNKIKKIQQARMEVQTSSNIYTAKLSETNLTTLILPRKHTLIIAPFPIIKHLAISS